MAGEGMSCLILSNEAEPLGRARDEIARGHGVEVEAVCLDLADADVAEQVARALGDRELGLLVSNASFGRTGPFQALDLATYRRMLAVNVDAYVALCHRFVPPMVQRGRGGVCSSRR